jgi:STE24 endopeptidase
MEKYLIVTLIVYLVVVFFSLWLDYLNLSHLKRYGATIPKEFKGEIDQALLSKTRDYTVENIQFGFVTSLFNTLLVLLFLFGGLLNTYNSWIASTNLSFIVSGLTFFLILIYADTVLTLPFSLYSTFKIEKKFGFSNMTPGLWITDFLKSIIVSTILTALLISVGLYLVEKSPFLWWLWLWGFFLIFSIFIMYISPYVIEPLFNKFTPIDDETLEDGIHDMMGKVGIKVSRVFKMDASKRTKHTNAYFTGIGKVKRIVLYDTLIDKMNNDEILSVLAHEVGHWKKKHILKRIVVTEAIALAALYLAFRLIESDFLLTLFNINEVTFFAKIVVLGFLGSIATFPFSPLFNCISRKHENEADRFAFDLTGNNQGLKSALVKLSKDNLSNLHPHPTYVLFHYSHPPVLQRIRNLEKMKIR